MPDGTPNRGTTLTALRRKRRYRDVHAVQEPDSLNMRLVLFNGLIAPRFHTTACDLIASVDLGELCGCISLNLVGIWEAARGPVEIRVAGVQ